MWVNPFGSIEPLPLSRRRCGDTGGDIAAIEKFRAAPRVFFVQVNCNRASKVVRK